MNSDKSNYKIWVLGGLIITLSGCSEPDITQKVDTETQRWYSKQQIVEGQNVFESNCVSCHGTKARGTLNWRKTNADGTYPPPPLNGKGHAWHHPYPLLFKTIADGSRGTMPAWKGKLTEEEMTSSVAYFQSFWPDEIYEIWLQKHER